MNQPSAHRSYSLSGFVCSAFGHDYIITRKVTNHINEYCCTHCGKEVTEDYNGKLEVLTVKNKEINSSLASFFQKKMKRRTLAT